MKGNPSNHTGSDALKLATIRHGNGPRRVICIHGFPDNPGTFQPILPQITAAGATVITPYLRGYGPSSVSPRNQYRPKDLGMDILRVMDAQRWEQAVVIGHDWGAMSAYMAAALAPERIQGVVAMSVPLPMQFLSGLRFSDQRKRSSYMAFFQLGRLAEGAFARNDFEAIDNLWRRWSPHLDLPKEHLAQVKATFTYPHTVRAALGYYRQLLPWGPTGWIPWLKSYRLATVPIQTKCLILHGASDGCIGPELFSPPGDGDSNISIAMHPDAGHFLQWEDPEWTSAQILGFMDTVYR